MRLTLLARRCTAQVRKLRIPAHEGYGAGGFPAWGIPPKATLLFEVRPIWS